MYGYLYIKCINIVANGCFMVMLQLCDGHVMDTLQFGYELFDEQLGVLQMVPTKIPLRHTQLIIKRS